MKKVICILACCITMFYGSTAKAIYFDYTPLQTLSVQFCSMCTPAAIQTVTQMYNSVNTVKDNLSFDNTVKGLLKGLKEYGISLGKSKLNQIINKKRNAKKVISYSRTIENCTIAGEINDKEKVKEAFKTLFLQYPSTKKNVKSLYDMKRDQFKIDTALEMYVTAQEEEKDVQNILIELPLIEKCLIAGTNGGNKDACDETVLDEFDCNKDGSEDKMCLYRMGLAVSRMYDQIMVINEYLAGMNAQYQASRQLSGVVFPLEYDEKDDSSKNSSETNSSDKQSGLIENVLGNEIKMASGEYLENEAYASLEFEDADDIGVKSIVAGKEDELGSLEVISEAQEALDSAIGAHNYKRLLPEYRTMFDNYHEFEEYYQKAMDMINISEDCTLNHLSHYNIDASEFVGDNCTRSSLLGKVNSNTGAMTGYKCGDDFTATEYMDRGGFSGWLMEVADIAKAKSTEGVEDLSGISSESKQKLADLAEEKNAELDEQEEISSAPDETFSTTKLNYGNINSSNINISSDSSTENGSYYKKASKEDDVESEARASHLRHWKIGAEVAKALGGTTWQNKEDFYDSGYLTYGKLQNMVEYIKETPMIEQIVALAEKIFENYNENAKNAKFATAEEKSEHATKLASYGSEFKKKINTLKDYLTENNVNTLLDEMDEILAEDKVAFKNLETAFDNNVKSHETAIASLYKQLDTLTTTLSDTNEKLNDANFNVSSAEVTISNSEDGVAYSVDDLYATRGLSEDTIKSSRLQNSSFQTKIDEQNDEKDKNTVTAANLELQVDNIQASIDKKKEEVENHQNQIKLLQAKYVKAYSDLENTYRVKLNEKIAERKKKLKELDNFLENSDPLIKLARNMIAGVRRAVIYKINLPNVEGLYYTGIEGKGCRDALTAVKEGLDYIKNNEITLEDVINPQEPKKCGEVLADYNDAYVEALSVPGAKYGEDIFDNSVITELLSSDAAELLNEWLKDYLNIFSNLTTQIAQVDSDYYVGIVGRAEDFRQPKSAPDGQEAPMREIIHFDENDFEAIWKYYVPKGSFLTDDADDAWELKQLTEDDTDPTATVILAGEPFVRSAEENGIYIPELWKLMLRHRSYVEKEYVRGDREFLGMTGYGDSEVVRSGIYHCYFDTKDDNRKYVYADPFAFGQSCLSGNCKEDGSAYQKCYMVKDFKLKSEMEASVMDRNDGFSRGLQRLGICPDGKDCLNIKGCIGKYMCDPWPLTCTKFLAAHELEQILLLYKDNNNVWRLGFNKALTSALKGVMNSYSDDTAENAAYIDARRQLFERNQLGSYLDYIELGQTAKEAMEEQQSQIERVRESIQEILNSLNLTIEDIDSLDLSDEDDYEAVKDALEKVKNAKVALLREKINGIKGESDIVKTRRAELEHSLEMLERDSEEKSGMSPDITEEELDANIAENEANQAVADEAAKSGTEAFRKAMENFDVPYCATIKEWL